MFHELLARSVAEAQDAARASTVAFLRACDIDRAGFETFVRGAVQFQGPIFYVSTVARGLAGSTSDLDLILVAPAATEEHLASQMLFHAGRRVGVKVLAEHGVTREMVRIAQAVSAPPAARHCKIRDAAGALSIKWVDLERLANGASFEGVTHADHLPALCRWSLVLHLADFRQAEAGFGLAMEAGRRGAALGYLAAAVEAAMDATMAAAGQIQSNVKWTYERWRCFRVRDRETAARDLVDALDAGLSDLRRGFAEPDALARVEGLLVAAFGDDVPPQVGNLTAAAHCSTFVPDAISLSTPERTVVMAADRLTALCSDASTRSQADAARALHLLQLGLLSFGAPGSAI